MRNSRCSSVGPKVRASVRKGAEVAQAQRGPAFGRAVASGFRSRRLILGLLGSFIEDSRVRSETNV